ncbi:type VI secretion system lipoprotein TssJ [Enterobacter mori]|uniref:type VI secretion system lipoprotein TssJ n=1 Tax=Enterobacter mori TaxID=539813 RepID=UPI00223552A8|nr:type VI secretion system lipoprotein TssJ [Enterobacter mori]MCW4990244.1 type VI secretion system lipoprotein TssJ [Enterobacter mori]
MLRTSLTKFARWQLVVLALSLTGCGVLQGITDGTRTAFTAIFYKKIKVLHLDFTAREVLNSDADDSRTLSVPVMVRVYQLKDTKIFDETTYPQLLKNGEALLDTDLLAARDMVLKPGDNARLDMPLEENTQYVAVVGLFRHPDMEKNTWKLTIEREELDPGEARVIEAGNNTLTLQPVEKK